MDLEFITNIFPSLIETLPLTIYIVSVTAVLGFLLAVVVTALRIKKMPVISQLLNMYTSFMRSTPGLIHIFIVYYGLPVLFASIGININVISRVTFSIVALVLYNGAFVSEILRPSYLAIPKAQHEAAISVGMTNWQKLTRIIFPQVLPIALPSLGNALIDLLKDTSLLFLIGLVDIMGQADIIIANTLGVYQLEVYVAVALIYWALSVVLEQVMRLLEKKTRKFVR
ncbi:amino acid ABC transporter permease [Desemzia sp. FAM 23991]|uniref:amino acid ABC transporter permease n=1 Tax=unclassified Desemzia TaxID=2685243 RepID=UPI0038878662